MLRLIPREPLNSGEIELKIVGTWELCIDVIQNPFLEIQLIPSHKEKIGVPRRFQWYIAEGMLSLPTAKWSMVISFFSGVMASGFAFGCAKDTVEFFNAGIGEVRFPVGEGFLLVIFDYVGPWV